MRRVRRAGLRRLLRLAALPLAWLPAAAAIGSEPPSYLFNLTAIEAPGGGATRAWAVNDAALVAGEVEAGSGAVQAFVWSHAQGMRVLGTLGGVNSRALDINESGLVVGESNISNGQMRAFAWTVSGGMRELPVGSNTIHSTALAVNDHGQIVGSMEDEHGMHAVLWQGDAITLLPQLPAAGHVQVLDINNGGHIVGQIQTGASEGFAGYAYFFAQAATASNLANFRLITDLGGSAAVAVNDQSMVTGYAMQDSSRVRAFRYLENGGITLLEDHGAQYSSSRDINEKGDIVGSCIPSYWSDELACAWLGGRWFDLNEVAETGSDWWLVEATGINRQRMVVGYGLRGEKHLAFALLPVDDRDPASWPLCTLDVREIREQGQEDRALVLSVAPRFEADIRRVLFYENGTVIGAVEKPPYEWGWQGLPASETEFYAEIHEKNGRRIRSPRHIVTPADPAR